MSEEELNQELSTDELKDVAGGAKTKINAEQLLEIGSGTSVKKGLEDLDTQAKFDINNDQKG